MNKSRKLIEVKEKNYSHLNKKQQQEQNSTVNNIQQNTP